MTDFDADDIRAMRQQGDLRQFLRDQAAIGKARREAEPAPTRTAPTGRQPGAWPPGTRPPSRPPGPQPGQAACETALADYRTWLKAGANPRSVGPPCPCPACTRATYPDIQE